MPPTGRSEQMEFTIRTSKDRDLLDVTEEVLRAASKGGVKDGVCLVYVPHATAGIIVNEFEPNIAHDFTQMFERLFPPGDYRHNMIDDNAQAHLKSGFVGPGASIPVTAGRLDLGTWQRIILCEFDGPRERRVIVKVVGK